MVTQYWLCVLFHCFICKKNYIYFVYTCIYLVKSAKQTLRPLWLFVFIFLHDLDLCVHCLSLLSCMLCCPCWAWLPTLYTTHRWGDGAWWLNTFPFLLIPHPNPLHIPHLNPGIGVWMDRNFYTLQLLLLWTCGRRKHRPYLKCWYFKGTWYTKSICGSIGHVGYRNLFLVNERQFFTCKLNRRLTLLVPAYTMHLHAV